MNDRNAEYLALYNRFQLTLIFTREDVERAEKKRRGEAGEGEEVLVTALDMEDKWKKEVRLLITR